MKKSILFVITALFAIVGLASCAEEKGLSAPSISLNDKVVSWSQVENAKSYDVMVNDNVVKSQEGISYTLEVTEIGSYEICVIAMAPKYKASEKSNKVIYKIEEPATTKLAAPVITLGEGVVSWSAVANATSYAVSVNNQAPTTQTGTSYTITATEVGSYVVSVIAKGVGLLDSSKSNEVTHIISTPRPDLIKLASPVISINKNVVSWTAIENASGYIVSVDGFALPQQAGLTYAIGETNVGVEKQISVAAAGKDDYANSDSSNTVLFTRYTFGNYDATNAGAALGANLDNDYEFDGLTLLKGGKVESRTGNNVAIGSFGEPLSIAYNLVGSSDGTKCGIKITTTGAALINVYFTNNSNNNTGRVVKIVDLEGKDVSYGTVPTVGTIATTVDTLSVPEAGTYIITGSNAFRIFEINVTSCDGVVATPANVAIDSSTRVASWSAVEGATGYIVTEIFTANGSSFIYKKSTKQTELTYTIEQTDQTAGKTIILVSAVINGKANSVLAEANYSVSVKLDTPVITNLDGVISWAKVANATKYLIYINGELILEQTSLTYTFVNTEIGSYSITVRAVSDGVIYTDSDVSEANVIVILPQLDSPVVTKVDNTISWEAVVNAVSYNIYVNGDLIANQTGLAFSLPTEAGDYCVNVVAVGDDISYCKSAHSNDIEYFVGGALEQPNLSLQNGVVTWEEVNSATGYIVTVNGEEKPQQTELSYTLPTEVGVYVVSVVAVADPLSQNTNSNSSVCVTHTILTKLVAPVITLSGNIVSYQAVANAEGYAIYIDGKLVLEQTELSYTLVLSGLGVYSISVIALADNINYDNSVISNVVDFVVSEQLVAPVVQATNNVLTWGVVENATGYAIYDKDGILGTITDGQSYTFKPRNGAQTYALHVISLGTEDGVYTNSVVSNYVIITVTGEQIELNTSEISFTKNAGEVVHNGNAVTDLSVLKGSTAAGKKDINAEYGGITYTASVKLEGTTVIKFTVSKQVKITVLWCGYKAGSSSIKIGSNLYGTQETTAIQTIYQFEVTLEAGTYEMMRGSAECSIVKITIEEQGTAADYTYTVETVQSIKAIVITKIDTLISGYEETQYSAENWTILSGLVSAEKAVVNGLNSFENLLKHDLSEFETSLKAVEKNQ